MVDDVSREVAPRSWARAVRSAWGSGHTYFDFLTAVEVPEPEGSPAVDIVVRLIDPTPGALRARRIWARLPDGESIESITPIFPGAAWHERETWEMFGVHFEGFTDPSGQGLRPLLLPEGFVGFPLRKSFPLASRAVAPWPGGKEPGEGHSSPRAPGRRRVSAPGVPGPEWGPR